MEEGHRRLKWFLGTVPAVPSYSKNLLLSHAPMASFTATIPSFGLQPLSFHHKLIHGYTWCIIVWYRCIWLNTHARAHTHTHIYIYIYICVLACAHMCVYYHHTCTDFTLHKVDIHIQCMYTWCLWHAFWHWHWYVNIHPYDHRHSHAGRLTAVPYSGLQCHPGP